MGSTGRYSVNRAEIRKAVRADVARNLEYENRLSNYNELSRNDLVIRLTDAGVREADTIGYGRTELAKRLANMEIGQNYNGTQITQTASGKWTLIAVNDTRRIFNTLDQAMYFVDHQSDLDNRARAVRESGGSVTQSSNRGPGRRRR